MQGQFITRARIVRTTNQRLLNLLLVIDRLFIQMNADYRGRFSMLRQLTGAMNKLLLDARTPVLSTSCSFKARFLNDTRPEYQFAAVVELNFYRLFRSLSNKVLDLNWIELT